MLKRPVAPQPVKKMRPPDLREHKMVSLMSPALPDAMNSRNFRITSSSTSNSSLRAAAMLALATSLKLAVTGWEDSVTSEPSLNWPLIFRNSSERFQETSFTVMS